MGERGDGLHELQAAGYDDLVHGVDGGGGHLNEHVAGLVVAVGKGSGRLSEDVRLAIFREDNGVHGGFSSVRVGKGGVLGPHGSAVCDMCFGVRWHM